MMRRRVWLWVGGYGGDKFLTLSNPHALSPGLIDERVVWMKRPENYAIYFTLVFAGFVFELRSRKHLPKVYYGCKCNLWNRKQPEFVTMISKRIDACFPRIVFRSKRNYSGWSEIIALYCSRGDRAVRASTETRARVWSVERVEWAEWVRCPEHRRPRVEEVR